MRAELQGLAALERIGHDRAVDAAGGDAATGKDVAGASGDEQQVGADLLPVVGRDRLDGRRVLRLDGAFQLRQVRQHAREDDVARGQRPLLLRDERGGVAHATSQLGLGLARGACADDVHGHTGRPDRQQRAREEDAVGERREERHFNGKSASTTR